MKNQLMLIISILSIFISFDVKAEIMNEYNDCYLINNNNICMSNEEYNNLINLGYNHIEILGISETEFDANKNLNGFIVSENVSYFFNDQIITKEEYDDISDNQTFFSPIETTAKKMNTTIISVNGRYRYKVSLEWKKMPSTRSNDIIAVGLNSNKVSYYGNRTFSMTYCNSNNNCTTSNSATFKNSSTGLGASFGLPTGTLSSLNMYFYYDVQKSANQVTSMSAYGDYSHATVSISAPAATNYSVNTSGIILGSSIVNYYDEISPSIANWSGNW